ncbi:MAG: four helix bundle protein [Chloroflexi bacterium]|nr:four helix bundle protein [Chloroflexota bacterium]
MGGTIKTHRDLDVYQMGFDTAMRIFELTKSFPKEGTYSLTDQIRRLLRSVCSNIAEAWRKRRYEAAFVSKLNDDTPVKRYSSGMYVRLAFAVAAHLESGFEQR